MTEMTMGQQLQAANQRLADLRREADLAAALLPDLAEKALEEARTRAAADNGAEQEMAAELDEWRARWEAVRDAARDALMEFIAASNAWNARVDRFRADARNSPNGANLGQRGPVTKATGGLHVLLMAADAIEASRDDDQLAKPYINELRWLRGSARQPGCTLDPRRR